MTDLATSLPESAARHAGRPALRMDALLTHGESRDADARAAADTYPRCVRLVESVTARPTGTMVRRAVEVPGDVVPQEVSA